MALVERLRHWLRRASSEPVGTGERDYLPEIAATELVRVTATFPDPSISVSEYAVALLIVARDGDMAARDAALDSLGTAAPRWWLAVDEALRQRWWSAPWSTSPMLLPGSRL